MSKSLSDAPSAEWAAGAEELPVHLTNVFSVKATSNGLILTVGHVVTPVNDDDASTLGLIAHPLVRTVMNPTVARDLGSSLIRIAKQVEERFSDTWSPHPDASE